MAEETRNQLKARLTTGSVINQTALHNLLDSAILKTTDTSTQLTEGTNLFHTAARVRDTDLEGLVSGTDEITEADSILSAIGKAKGLIGQLSAGTYTSGAVESATVDFQYTNNRHGDNAAITGNITIEPAGTNYGAWFTMVHNDATAPDIIAGAYTTVSELNSISSFYRANEDNVICGLFFGTGSVFAWIIPQTIFTEPTAFNLALTGTGGASIALAYEYIGTFPETASVYQFYRADDTNGTNAAAISGATGTTTAATGATYTIVLADDTKYIRAGISPKDSQINSGTQVFSAWQGPQAFAAAFSPSDIAVSAGMIHFKDFTDVDSITIDSATYSPTDAIASVADLYTGLIADRSAAIQRPIYIAASAGTGNHRAFASNVANTSELIQAHNSAINIPAGSNLTTIIGCLIKDTTSTETLFQKGGAANSGQFVYRKVAAALRIYLNCTGGFRLVVNHAGVFEAGDVDENIVLVHTWDGTSHELYKNGVDLEVSSAFTEAIVADVTNSVWIGSEVNTNHWKGEIGVILQYASALSTENRQACEAWINDNLSIPA